MRHFALFGLLALAGCGPSGRCTGASCNGGPDGGIGNGQVTVSPANASLTVNGGPATQQFTANDKNDGDVTSKASWAVGDTSMGDISPTGLFTAKYPLPHGGSTSITATYKNNIGGANVVIQYVAPPVVDPSAPASAPMDFGGPASSDPQENPKPVYPFGGTLLARNINQMNLQWIGNAKDSEYQVHFVGDTIDLSFFVGKMLCKNGTQCSYTPADKDWQTIAQSASGKNVSFTISATAGNGQPVAASAPVPLNFSPEDVQGGLYYFSTSAQGIKRLPFGASTATDFIKNGNGNNCAGCHAVSHDGSKVAATFWYGDGWSGMVDGANGNNFLIKPKNYNTAMPTTQSTDTWNFATFSPDGKQLLTNWAGRLQLRDGTTGALIMEVPPNLVGAKAAAMPEWSPDGKNIAFVGIPPEGAIGKDISAFPGAIVAGDWILGNGGDIMVMPYNGGQFGQAQVIVPSTAQSEYNFYPSWSPDSNWIVFATGQYPGSSPTAAGNGVDTSNKCMSYDQDTARLRLVKASGGAVIELSAATHVMKRTATWPKFAPFIQNGGQLVFITFSSKFAYGFVVPDGARPQLWMAAIDLNKANSELGAGDPSYPPFWLPFQDPSQNNHEAIWTTQVNCDPMNPDGDCPPEFTCQNGMCVQNPG